MNNDIVVDINNVDDILFGVVFKVAAGTAHHTNIRLNDSSSIQTLAMVSLEKYFYLNIHIRKTSTSREMRYI